MNHQGREGRKLRMGKIALEATAVVQGIVRSQAKEKQWPQFMLCKPSEVKTAPLCALM